MAVFTAIAAVTAWVASVGVAAGLAAATAAALATTIVSTAISLGISLVVRMLQPKVSVPRAEIQAVLNQTDAPRRVFVGQNLVGGIRALFDVRGGALHQIIVVAHGQVSEFSRFWVDGKPVERNAGGHVTTGKYSHPGGYYVQATTRDGGSRDGGDYQSARNAFSYWTNARRLAGQAAFHVVMWAPSAAAFSKVFPKGSNTDLQWEIKGQQVYDPRIQSSGYSDNAALVIRHYLRSPDGYRLSGAEYHDESVKAMADVADIPIPQKEGGTAPNLRLWGYWTMDEPPVDVLGRMHSSSGIRAYETQDGSIGLIGGAFGIPACTLTAKDIREIKTSEAINEREGYNILRVFHIDAEQEYELTEVDPWKDSARLDAEGEIVQEYKMEMCPNRSQARRLAKQQIHNDNRAKVEIVTNLVGLKARFPKHYAQRHTILLDYKPEDGSGREIVGEYEVMDHEIDPINLECRIELEKISRESEAWTPAEEGGTTEALPPPEPNPAPDISAILTQRIIQASANNRIGSLEVSAVPIPDRDDLEIQAQYRKTGSSQWLSMQASNYTAVSGAVEDGREYEARVRFNGIFDEPDDWEALGPITIQIDSTPPAAPTELIPSNGTGYVHLSWRNPSAAFAELRVYRNTTADFGGAALVGTTGGAQGQISEFQDSTIAAETEYNYWVAAANMSGIEGTPAGPANITTN